MQIDSSKWLKLGSGSEMRGPESVWTDSRAEKLGYAFACWLAERLGTTSDALKLAVGRDLKPSGERIMAALIRGITAADSDVLDCGQCAAPALFMTTLPGPDPADGAVMVSGDGGPKQSGFKFITSGGGLKDADVTQILLRASEAEVPERLVIRHDASARYFESLRNVVAVQLEDDALKPLLGMRVAVDARSGVGEEYARFLEELGVETVAFGSRDDMPNPKSPEALSEAAQAVLANRADLGVIFDADGDRASIVDQDGRPFDGNRLIALTAAMLLDHQSGSTFVTDSVTSSGLSAFIAEWGGVHYRFKRGYRHVIDEAIRLNDEGIDCPLAIETSGHAAFRENGFLDDGIYLVTRIICEALNRKREGLSLSSLIDGLQEPVESVEIRLPVLDEEDPSAASQEVVEALLSHTLSDPGWQRAPDNREGVRITFNLDGGVNNAWFQLRMSVHDPVMVLDAQSDVPGGIGRILEELYALIRETELLDLTPLREALSKR